MNLVNVRYDIYLSPIPHVPVHCLHVLLHPVHPGHLQLQIVPLVLPLLHQLPHSLLLQLQLCHLAIM